MIKKVAGSGKKYRKPAERGAHLAKEEIATYRYHPVGSSAHATATVRVDRKGRLTLPKQLRAELGVVPGDTFFMRRRGSVISFIKAEDPFVALARHAIKEADAGRTRSLRSYAEDRDVDLTKNNE